MTSKEDNSPPAWLTGITGEYLPPLIVSDARVIRVVAGPGSGKTTGLKRRVQRLVEGDGVDPRRIFVGTFTRAVASGLRDELGAEVQVSTLHSLAYRLLREHPAARVDMSLRFLLQYEEDCMLYDIAPSVPHLATQPERQNALRRMQSARAERAALPDAAFAGAVERWLREHGGMLVGEVVHYAVQALAAGDISPGLYDHVIVDEYQDLTAAEQTLVELIWSRTGSLVVLGDNDQSIYSFRFNHPGGVDEFRDRWHNEGLLDLAIPENRRCGEGIVDMANTMMAEAGSSKQPMQAMSGRAGELDVVRWESDQDEIAGLATWIQSKPEESFLVLVTRRLLGYRLKEAVGARAQTAFHEEVLDSKPVLVRFAAASVLANPDDWVAVRAWLGFRGSLPENAAGRNHVAYTSARTSSPAEASAFLAGVAGGAIPVTGSGRAAIIARCGEMSALQTSMENLSLNEQIELLFGDAAAEFTDEDDERRRWALADMSLIRTAALAHATAPGATLSSVIQLLRYRIATRAPLVDVDDEPNVRIMTLHSAKGLEGDNIVLMGVADQLIPGGEALPAKREEQRRLLYVAVTRAKNHLVVSWPRSMRFSDAVRNYVRRDTIATRNGERVFVLSRSSLLPQSLVGAEPGETWLGRRT